MLSFFLLLSYFGTSNFGSSSNALFIRFTFTNFFFMAIMDGNNFFLFSLVPVICPPMPTCNMGPDKIRARARMEKCFQSGPGPYLVIHTISHTTYTLQPFKRCLKNWNEYFFFPVLKTIDFFVLPSCCTVVMLGAFFNAFFNGKKRIFLLYSASRIFV